MVSIAIQFNTALYILSEKLLSVLQTVSDLFENCCLFFKVGYTYKRIEYLHNFCYWYKLYMIGKRNLARMSLDYIK